MSVTDTGHVGNRHSVCLYPPADIGTSAGLQIKKKDQPRVIVCRGKITSMFITDNKGKRARRQVSVFISIEGKGG